MCLAQIIFRNVRTPLFLNSFIQDFIANFCITCWVRMHPNADTFKYFFLLKSKRQWICYIVISSFFNVVTDF